MTIIEAGKYKEADTDVLPGVRHLSTEKEKKYIIKEKGEGFVS